MAGINIEAQIAEAKNNSDDKYDLVYEGITDTYDKVHEFADALTSKAGNTAGFIGVIFAISAKLWWDINNSNIIKKDIETINLGFAWIFGLLLLAMLFTLFTFFSTKYAVFPGPNYLFRICYDEDWPKEKILKNLCHFSREATHRNIEINDLRSRNLNCGIALLGIGILSFMFMTLYVIFIVLGR